MKLSKKSVENERDKWLKSGYKLPEFDIDMMRERTRKEPSWVHFGAGNIFRAFPAVLCQRLLNRGETDRGIIVAEGYDYEILENCFHKTDNLTLSVVLNSDGTVEKEVVASVAEALALDFENREDTARLEEIFSAKSLAMVSFTITEKGYSLKGAEGEYYGEVARDFEREPSQAKTYMGRLAALLHHRYKSGGYAVALVSMDNCAHNGDRLKSAVGDFARHWVKNGFADKGFESYIENSVSFPCTMIDKITPRPFEEVQRLLERDGIEGIKPFETEKHTFAAAFVNAEAPQYLVIEDDFPNSRIPLEKAGVIYTDRETVDRSERMKVCTCLNPLHTCLAIFGCLLGYDRISDEMKDEQLSELVKRVGHDEGLPVVDDPKIIEPRRFLDEVLTKRFANSFIIDTPQRIACDTSQKLGVRFGETIKRYAEVGKADSLEYIPLVFAGWCRYLLGVDDEGNSFEPSPDPMLGYAVGIMNEIGFGCTDGEKIHGSIKKLLSDEKIFGVNLYDSGIGLKVEKYFGEMNKNPGAVRRALEKYLQTG